MAIYQGLLEECLENALEDHPQSWCNEKEWRYLTSFTSNPDSVGQISHIYDIDIAGTINLFPKDGIGYNSKVPGRHAGEHFHEKDAWVGIWGPPVKASSKLRTQVNGSVPVVIYEYLNGSKVDKSDVGWGYESFIDKLNIDTK